MYAIQKAAMAFVMLVFTATIAPTSTAGDGNNSKPAPMKFVGTYYGLSGAGALVTLHSDGTMSAVSSDMFSDDLSNSFQGRKATPSRGVWQVIGENTVRVTAIRFLTEASGHNFVPDGVIMKNSWEAVFDKPVHGRSPGYTSGDVSSKFYLPGANPFSDEPVFELVTPFDGVAVRLVGE